jgi:CIC family chloride channel protein
MADRPTLRPLRPSHQLALVAGVLGAAVGLAVALFERAVRRGAIEHLLEAPLWAQAMVPTVGLALAALLAARGSHEPEPGVADEYVRAFHRGEPVRLRDVPRRLAAAAATLASGAPLGFEGPAIYVGAAAGSVTGRLPWRRWTREQRNALLVAGAAAGVAAIFKAPATGALFALEVPYQADLARRSLLPALFASATGYLAFVAVEGTEPLFAIGTTAPLDTADLLAAIAIGLLAGIGARAFAGLLALTKRAAASVPRWAAVGVGGSALAGLIVASEALTGAPLALGPGYAVIGWIFEADHTVGLLLGVLAIRAVATAAAVGGGGVGGLFIPLVIQGALLGQVVGAATGNAGSALFPVLGVAAFLAAGYHVPLAAVVFVAETTGQPGFVVPGLLAAAASQLTIGSASVSSHQRSRRMGHLERRLSLPISSVLKTDAATVPSDATAAEVFDHHMLGVRLLAVPVVDGSTYRGIVHLRDITDLSPDQRTSTVVGDIARDDHTVGDLTWTVGRALAALEANDTDRLAVTDAAGAYVGLVTLGEVLKLDEILDAEEHRPSA